jgi:hypothetical protein
MQIRKEAVSTLQMSVEPTNEKKGKLSDTLLVEASGM